MNSTLKVRNLKSENICSMILDLFLLLVIAMGLWLVMPAYFIVGDKNEIVLNLLYAFGIMCFMAALEKYSVTIAGMQEKVVINVLSALYTFVCMCIVNLIFFNVREKYISDVIYALLAVALLTASDYIMKIIFANPKRYRKPRLLIISSREKTFLRMKRIKYGALSSYDSWYENLDGIDFGEFKEFAKKRFSEFDAICILDGLGENEYNIAVKTAINLQKDLFIVPNMIDVGKTNAKQVRFDDVLTLYMPKHYISRAEFLLKRIMDLVIGTFALIVAAVPMLIIAIAIKLTSPGPVLYKQERMTKDKKRFMIYKFRTMIPDAEKLTGPKFAEKDDPRITKIGKILRSCRLDELPQIFNILKSDMSIVGPRPERPVFVEHFEKEIENYDYRFAVKAGLTSLSHVYGRYSTYIHDRTYYDIFYITNYSFLMDLKIILLTTKTMFIKSSAEGEDDFKENTSVENINKSTKIKEEVNL
ncbi:MAG: exopolysaccharide biosynthesis polyprenyl glycosylphosphotransferase [Clostridia bacterium]|nr:exopolysaccharide biosynthesis polyprenyl glycosylphosphotransferase [Clostridia bacterium]